MMRSNARQIDRLRLCVWIALLGLAFGCVGAEGQVAPDAGSILRQQQPPALELPPEPLPPLQTVEPAPPPVQAPQNLRFVLQGWRFTGQTVFSEAELAAVVQDLLGANVGAIGLVDLEEAAARVSRHYREHGYLVARAYIPPQDIRDGIVEIAVLEGRVGRVVIDNQSRVRDGLVEARVADLQGELVREENINLRLRLTYDLEGIGAGSPAELHAGANPGETDLMLALGSGPFLTGSVKLDNYGNRFSGGNRLSGEMNIHSPTHSGDLLSLQGTVGEPNLDLYRLAYELPSGSLGMRLGAEISRVGYTLGRDFSALEANGTADTWLAFASHPLVLGRTFSAHLRLSYEQSQIQDRIDSTGVLTDKASRLATLALTGDWRNPAAGGSATALSLSYGRGDLDIESPSAFAIDAVTARTQGNFAKWNLGITRLQRLTQRTSLFLSYTGQLAQKNLDSSEKLILGGPYGIKVYPEGEAPGDSGHIVNFELRYDVRNSFLPGQLQLLGLLDIGQTTTNENPFLAGSNHRRLKSTGVGINWVGAHGVYVRLILARKLGDAPASSDEDRETRAWLQTFKRF